MFDHLIITREHGKVLLADKEEFDSLFNRKLCFIKEYQILQQQIDIGYFIGVDWIIVNKKALYVQPKLNDESAETNYLLMLFSSLKHPELAKYSSGLVDINFNSPFIKIHQKQDLLTPLLVVQFLQIVKNIVKKGVKKSYYRKEENLYGRVKGKVQVGKTIKVNILGINRCTHIVNTTNMG
jgi:hypothetical protein